MPDLSAILCRLDLLESRVTLAERAIAMEMLDLIRQVRPLEGPGEQPE